MPGWPGSSSSAAICLLALTALQDFEATRTLAQAKKNLLQAIEAVAGLLGNTRTVCRKSYIHPAILDSYMNGSLARPATRRGAGRGAAIGRRAVAALRAEEYAVLAVLRRAVKDVRQRAA